MFFLLLMVWAQSSQFDSNKQPKNKNTSVCCQRFPESCFYKKVRERTLETFLEKPHSHQYVNLPTGSISKGSRSLRGRPYKKEKKRTLKMFLEKPHSHQHVNLPTGSISKGSRSLRGRPYKKEKKRTLKTFLEKPHFQLARQLAYCISKFNRA